MNQSGQKNDSSKKGSFFPKKRKRNIDDAIEAFLSFKAKEKSEGKKTPLKKQASTTKKTPIKNTPSKKNLNNKNYYQKQNNSLKKSPKKETTPKKHYQERPRIHRETNSSHYLMKPHIPPQKMFPYLTPKQSFEKHIPPPKELHKKHGEKDVLRIIPFGGMEQVGLNCIGFEYNEEIVLIDMGVQFPDEHMHGVNSRIPDLNYLKGKKILGIVITHGHIDHIGAIPYVMRFIGLDTKIYAGKMAKELINLKQEDFKMPLNIYEMHRNKVISISNNFIIEPFTVDHSIPDSMGVRIITPVGKFIHTGDWKFDHDPRDGSVTTDHEQLKRFGKEGIRALLSDSTNSH